jgi:hypothetical protein
MDFDQVRWSSIKINPIKTRRVRVKSLVKLECSESNLWLSRLKSPPLEVENDLAIPLLLQICYKSTTEHDLTICSFCDRAEIAKIQLLSAVHNLQGNWVCVNWSTTLLIIFSKDSIFILLFSTPGMDYLRRVIRLTLRRCKIWQYRRLWQQQSIKR